MTDGDTIFALSSGHGRAAVAVIRLSGRLARPAAERLVGQLPTERMGRLRTLKVPASREVIDHGLVLWFAGPHTATGEDIVELHVHGSPSVIDRVLGCLEQVEGLRPAEAGEFTLRAFRNGRLSLLEAEGLADLLAAQTEAQRKQAVFQFLGGSASVLESWRKRLISALALVEASVDFVEERDVAADAVNQGLKIVRDLIVDVEAEMARSEKMSAVRDGIRVVLAGLPNTGKSSLLNAMARREAAIVSALPGTTRDVIEVMLSLDGLPVVVRDTAGLRAGVADAIERIGIARSWQAIADSDVVVWVAAPDVPGSFDVAPDVRADLLVSNKADLAEAEKFPGDGWVRASSGADGNVSDMISELGRIVKARYGEAGQASLVRSRHRSAAQDSIRLLNDSLRHGPDEPELIGEDLRAAAVCLGRITGAIGVEDLLDSIFSEFCVGK